MFNEPNNVVHERQRTTMSDRCPTPSDEVELTLDEDVEKVVK